MGRIVKIQARKRNPTAIASVNTRDEEPVSGSAVLEIARPIGIVKDIFSGDNDEGESIVALSIESESEAGTTPRQASGQHRPSIFSPISAIGLVRAQVFRAKGAETIKVMDCRAGGNADSDEKSIVQGLWFALKSWRPKVVTFGGCTHGLPALRLASMRHGITIPEWACHLDIDRPTGCGRNSIYHVDLKAILTGDGPTEGGCTLDDVVKAIWGASWKNKDVSGRHMAEVNAALVFILYMRWRLFTGETEKKLHGEVIESLRGILREHAGSNPAVAKLVKAWSIFQV